MDDIAMVGAGGGSGGGSTPSSAASVWDGAPAWSDTPTFDVAVGGGQPAPPTSSVDLGMAATTIFGLDFTFTTGPGIYSQHQLGGQINVQCSPLAPFLALEGYGGVSEKLAVPGVLSNLGCCVGPSANILFGRSININCGPEGMTYNSDGKGATERTVGLLVFALASAYSITCFLLADNKIWGQEKEGDLVAGYQAAMQLLLSVFLVGYVRAAHAEEAATAAEFELLIDDHIGTQVTP